MNAAIARYPEVTMAKKRCYLYNFPRMAGEPRVKEPSILYSVPDKRIWDSEFVFNGEAKPGGDLYLVLGLHLRLSRFPGVFKKDRTGKK